MAADTEEVTRRAASVWRYRHRMELEAVQRFTWLATELAQVGASSRIVALAEQAASDERRHAELCRDLVQHFGGSVGEVAPTLPKRVSPERWRREERLLYEMVAMSCVTETLSTALLGALVERASDSLTKRTMHSILRDEVMHSQVGWAFLAEQRAGGAPDCIGPHLPAMLQSTLGPGFFDTDPLAAELSGLGCLDGASNRRIVAEALSLVVFPGLARFGIDVKPGLAWLAAA